MPTQKGFCNTMKNILAIETSGNILSVAVKRKHGGLTESETTGFLKNAENLLPLADSLLKKNRLSIQAIDVFLIDRGPGSFTGLRIGFSILKGLLEPKKRPCFGALSLDMIAENITLPEKTRLAVCLDAYKEKIYARCYHRQQGRWKPSGKAQVLTAQNCVNTIPSEVFVVGSAIKRYESFFREPESGKKIHLLTEQDWQPKASTLIRWFEQFNLDSKHLSKNKTASPLQLLKKPNDFLPLYFRRSEAEENRNAYAASR